MAKQAPSKKAPGAKRQISQRKNKKAAAKKVEWKFPLKRNNIFIIGIGFLVILLGYASMATGLGEDYAVVDGSWNSFTAISLGPLLLVIGYCIIIPFGIYKYFGKSE